MKRLALAAMVLASVAGCSTVPFRAAEPVRMDNVEPASVLERFRESMPVRFRLMSSIVFEFSWNKVSALGITEVDRREGTFTAMAMNPLGVKLFELSGTAERVTAAFIMEAFPRRDDAGAAIGEDIRRIYFGLLPSPSAKADRERYRIVFRELSGPGMMEYVFAGADGLMVEKKYVEADETVWKASYYEYRRSGGKAFPMGIVFDNYRYGYRLVVKVKEILA